MFKPSAKYGYSPLINLFPLTRAESSINQSVSSKDKSMKVSIFFPILSFSCFSKAYTSAQKYDYKSFLQDLEKWKWKTDLWVKICSCERKVHNKFRIFKNLRLKFVIFAEKKIKHIKKHDEVVKQLQSEIEKYSCNQCEKKFCRRWEKNGKSKWRKRALLCPMQ